MDINFIINELGEDREKYFNATAPPIIRSSNFVFPDVASFRVAFADEMNSHIYTRGNNPTVEILRKKLAALENTEDALLTGSGIAAISASVMAFVSQGDHIICVDKPYGWANKLMGEYLPRFGVKTTFVDASNLDEINAALQPNTKVLYLESPNTFTFDIQDLEACANWAKANNIITMIDNSYASPMYQNPAKFGIDIITHSVTKYINGHSDIVAGVICGSKSHIQKIFLNEYMTLGTILSPADAAWILRGLRTLPIRMERISKSTKIVIERLKSHPKVERILYPFDRDFPQLELAKKQMSGCGGLFTVVLVDTAIEDIINLIDSLDRFKLAVSWGGHESLIMPGAAFYNLSESVKPLWPHTYMRIYIGLEDPEYLLEELIEQLDLL